MKKFLKITGIVFAVLLVLIFIALKIAPGIIKDYIVNHSEELIGRKVAIEDISLNPLTFTLNVDNFILLEQDGTTPFVSFDKFRINVNPSELITKTASVSEVYLKGLYVHVTQNGDKFNFSDILEFLSKKDSCVTEQPTDVADTASQDSTAMINAAEIANSLPVNISIENIVFEKGNIIYEDNKVGSKIHLQDFGVKIPAVYLSNKSTDVGVSFKFADGGDLNVKVNANMATNDFEVHIGLEKFALACGKPYLNDFIKYSDFSGYVSTQMLVQGNLNSILASNVKGTVSVDSIVLTETSGKTIGVNHVGVGIAEANLDKNKFVIDSVIVDGAFAHLDLYKGGKTNIDVLLEPLKNKTAESAPVADSSKVETEEKKSDPSAKKLQAKIVSLQVKNTSVSANDQTLKKPFNFKVSSINVVGNNVSLDEPFTVNVSAAFPEGGSVNVKARGSLADMGSIDAYISIKNLALKHFSNYSHHFTGYPITAGTMAFASENKIKDFNLDSKNTIDIYNIEVGDKDPDTDPEFMVPMKVGLYILKDKDDKIQFDVPVTGNLKDPEFSYLKIVWKTVMNLLIKVALSPLKIVGNVATSGASMVGIDLGKNDEVLIDVHSATFTSEQYAKATKMTEALSKDPKLTLTFTQYYSPKKVAEEFKTHKMKTEFYKQSQGKTTLNEIDERAILEIKDSDDAYQTYAKEHGASIDIKSLQQELASLATKRNEDLLKVLKQQKGVTAKNLKVITAPKGNLNSYRGKPMYKISVDIQ